MILNKPHPKKWEHEPALQLGGSRCALNWFLESLWKITTIQTWIKIFCGASLTKPPFKGDIGGLVVITWPDICRKNAWPANSQHPRKTSRLPNSWKVKMLWEIHLRRWSCRSSLDCLWLVNQPPPRNSQKVPYDILWCRAKMKTHEGVPFFWGRRLNSPLFLDSHSHVFCWKLSNPLPVIPYQTWGSVYRTLRPYGLLEGPNTYSLEVQPPFFIGWFPNHHCFSRGLSSSKRNHHF